MEKNILKEFKVRFPDLYSKMTNWSDAGKDKIKLRFSNRQTLIFTYKDDLFWGLETTEKNQDVLKLTIFKKEREV